MLCTTINEVMNFFFAPDLVVRSIEDTKPAGQKLLTGIHLHHTHEQQALLSHPQIMILSSEGDLVFLPGWYGSFSRGFPNSQAPQQTTSLDRNTWPLARFHFDVISGSKGLHAGYYSAQSGLWT